MANSNSSRNNSVHKKASKKAAPNSLATRSRGVGVVRIVGGKFKRTPLPVTDREGLRPTTERVRETVFDWLTHLTGGYAELAVLDMFAGSGAMGLEAASRGAGRVVSIEKDRKSAANIKALVEKLGALDTVNVLCADSFAYLEKTAEKFDVIFIDPPFALNWQIKAAKAALTRLTHNGIIYIEAEAPVEEEALAQIGLESIRRSKAGAVHYLLAVRKTQTETSENQEQ